MKCRLGLCQERTEMLLLSKRRSFAGPSVRPSAAPAVASPVGLVLASTQHFRKRWAQRELAQHLPAIDPEQPVAQFAEQLSDCRKTQALCRQGAARPWPSAHGVDWQEQSCREQNCQDFGAGQEHQLERPWPQLPIRSAALEGERGSQQPPKALVHSQADRMQITKKSRTALAAREH